MSFSRGIFLTQGLNAGLPHRRQTPYHLSHQGDYMGLKESFTKEIISELVLKKISEEFTKTGRRNRHSRQ